MMTFHFDAAAHEYSTPAGRVLPHITGMLQKSGWIDDRWYTEESSARGTAVHQLTADYDLGALDPKACVSMFRGYLLGHVTAMKLLKPEILEVETPHVHPGWCYGGRPDRLMVVHQLRSTFELKSGARDRAHQIQTALQVILVETEYSLPAEAWGRYCLYLQDRGRFKLEEHTDRRDFDEAYRLIKRYC